MNFFRWGVGAKAGAKAARAPLIEPRVRLQLCLVLGLDPPDPAVGNGWGWGQTRVAGGCPHSRMGGWNAPPPKPFIALTSNNLQPDQSSRGCDPDSPTSIVVSSPLPRKGPSWWREKKDKPQTTQFVQITTAMRWAKTQSAEISSVIPAVALPGGVLYHRLVVHPTPPLGGVDFTTTEKRNPRIRNCFLTHFFAYFFLGCLVIFCMYFCFILVLFCLLLLCIVG